MTGWWFQRLPIVPPQKSRTQLVLRLVVSSCLLHFYKAASQRLSLRWVRCQAEMLWWMQRTACVESNPVTLGWLKRQEYTPKKEKPKIILKKYNSTIKLYLFLCPIFFGVAIGWITMDNPRTSTRFDDFLRMSWINGGSPVTMGFYTKMVQRLGWGGHMVPAFWETSCVLWNFLHVALVEIQNVCERRVFPSSKSNFGGMYTDPNDGTLIPRSLPYYPNNKPQWYGKRGT